jgi:outer membrane protein
MKKGLTIFCMALALTMSGTAGAEEIAGKFGVTGRIGFLVPADSEATTVYGTDIQNISTNVGFAGGGGFLYGINKNFAAELDITYTGFTGDRIFGCFDFNIINIALGGQYRFKEMSKFTPYVGAGIDILVNGADNGYNVDTVPGIHLAGGVDYFLTKNLALNSELKFVVAPNADITTFGGLKVGNFDPSSFSMTFGVRYFIN